MFFRIFDDGMGGYFGYLTTPGMEAAADFAMPILILLFFGLPIIALLLLGSYVMIPLVIFILGLLLLYGGFIEENILLRYLKFALAFPPLIYFVTCLPYSMGQFSKDHPGEQGAVMLLTALIGLAGLILLAIATSGIGAIFILPWCAGFFSAFSENSDPWFTTGIMRFFYLTSVVVLIVGIVNAIRESKLGSIHLASKMIALVLGVLAAVIPCLLSSEKYQIVLLASLASFLIAYVIYQFVLKQPSQFADWLLYPFLLLLGGYYLENAESDFLFPSDLLHAVINAFAPANSFFTKAAEVADAFSELVSDLCYWFVGLFGSASHLNVPTLIGAAVMIGLVSGCCMLALLVLRKKKV